MRSLVVIAVMLAPHVAHAQYNVPSQASGDSRGAVEIANDDNYEKRGEMIAVPEKTAIGWELGASLDFITSDGPRAIQPVGGVVLAPAPGSGLLNNEIKFTDLVLFKVHGLVAIGRRFELFAGVDLLPKQPSFTDEHKWQGSLLGARYRVDKNWSAYARGQYGPNLDHDGFWTVGEAAVQYKRDIAEKALFWESNIGGTYTQLFFDEQDQPFQLAELLAETGIALRDRHGIFATWLTFSFHFPMFGVPDKPDASGRENDPQVRVGMFFGMLVGVNKSLDLFIEGSIIDRGDLEDPATTLPVLEGGFDQKRILFGFNKRFGKRRR